MAEDKKQEPEPTKDKAPPPRDDRDDRRPSDVIPIKPTNPETHIPWDTVKVRC